MTETIETTDRSDLSQDGQSLLAPIRLAVGALQGLALWALERSSGSSELDHLSHPVRSWPATVPELYAPLLLIAAFIPVLLLAGIGRMRMITLAIWIAVAAALLALMGWHEVARQSAETLLNPPYLNSPMPLFAAAALFIGHHLILPADMERRWVAGFPTYFDTAWKAAVQLALSLAFTGVFWILLSLGAGLFRVIGLDFLEELTRKAWFAIPITTFVFSVAVHLTDVRDGLIRGVRAVGLMLLSWLLLVITVLMAGFVVALPFTGLKGLWETGSATSLVLSAVAALVILTNAAYQDGRIENRPPLPVRLAVQAASLLLVPLVVIAFWGLFLRIGQHGLTPDRIIALACAVVGAVFAAGYAWASIRTALRKGDWMRPLEPTTLAGAALAFILIVALFSPVADPARLSVADQVARLERGAVKPDQFDFRFLRFQSGKAGETALATLARSSNPDIARRATNVAALKDRWSDRYEGVPEHVPVFEVIGAPLPSDFAVQVSRRDMRYDCDKPGDCVARAQDLDGDGQVEVLVANAYSVHLMARDAQGAWTRQGQYLPYRCVGGERGDPRERLRTGQVRPEEPRWPDLAFGDGPPVTGDLDPRRRCPAAATPPNAPSPVLVGEDAD